MSDREKVDAYFEKKDPFPKECAKCGRVITSAERTWQYTKEKSRGLRPVCKKGDCGCKTDTS